MLKPVGPGASLSLQPASPAFYGESSPRDPILPPSNHLVRIGAVRALVAGRDGELTLELTDGRKVPVARRARRVAKVALSAER